MARTRFRNRTDIQTLTEACRITRDVCRELMEAAQPGASTIDLEQLANKLLQQNRSSAPFKQFQGFGQAICISLNTEIVNGPPYRERYLKSGDLVSLALGACYKGIHAKIARTWHLGDDPPSADVTRLLDGTRTAIDRAMAASRHTRDLRTILEAISQTATDFQLTVLDHLGGAGTGRDMHEEPSLPNQAHLVLDPVKIEPGQALVLMPMFSLGTAPEWLIADDGWTCVTSDGSLSAHFADTLLMTPSGLQCLTRDD